MGTKKKPHVNEDPAAAAGTILTFSSPQKSHDAEVGLGWNHLN